MVSKPSFGIIADSVLLVNLATIVSIRAARSESVAGALRMFSSSCRASCNMTFPGGGGDGDGGGGHPGGEGGDGIDGG